MIPDNAVLVVLAHAVRKEPFFIPELKGGRAIDALGRPVNFQVEAASDPQWGAEAIAFVREWKFTPGGGNVPCMLTLVWGERKMDVEILEQLSASCCIKAE